MKIINRDFEKESLEKFENLLNGYRKAQETFTWESNIDELVDKITHLPTDPFSIRLMELFDYDYIVSGDSINLILEKSLIIREQMQSMKRFVNVTEEYYRIPFLKKDRFINKVEILNNDGELCYQIQNRISINYRELFYQTIFSLYQKIKLDDILTFDKEVIEFKKLEIFYYSEFIDLSTISKESFYSFYIDYYGKTQFKRFLQSKESLDLEPTLLPSLNKCILNDVAKLSKVQQTLWAFYIFRLFGLDLRSNLGVVNMTRFLLLINNDNTVNYKNSYFYKLALKVKDNKKGRSYLTNLSIVETMFERNNFPTDDIKNDFLGFKVK